MWFNWNNVVLTALQAACVLAPAAGLPAWLDRGRGRGWALLLPLSLVGTIVVISAIPASADVYTWLALLLVPVGAALAFGWAARGARPWLAVLAPVLLALAWVGPEHIAGQLGGDVLIAASAVTVGRLLGGSAPLLLLKAGLVLMAAFDAWLVFGGLLEAPNDALVAAIPAPGLPQLQAAALQGASLGYGDFLAAAVLGGVLAAESGPRGVQGRLAVAVLVVSLAWDQLFLVVDVLPATVPVALVLLGWEGCRWLSGGRRTAPERARTVP